MRINRFFGNFDFGTQEIKISNKEICRQIKNVLRLGPGQGIVLCNGDLKEAVVEIVDISKTGVLGKIIELRENHCEPKTKIVLYASILKGERFDFLVEKATEVGVSEIVPIICKRTIKTGIKKARLEKIIKEAAEQSGRGILPILSQKMEFEKAIREAPGNNLNLFFEPEGEKPVKLDFLNNAQKIGVWIGPEGGWSEEEIEKAKKASFKILSVSKLIFRAETAAIIASYLALLYENQR